MSNHNQELQAAITEGDGAKIHSILVASNFILLSASMVGEDHAEDVGALTAEMGNMQVLVAFTDELTAKAFVDKMADFFEEDELVEGIAVEGAAMLDCIPEGHGILLDAELETNILIPPDLASKVKSLQA